MRKLFRPTPAPFLKEDAFLSKLSTRQEVKFQLHLSRNVLIAIVVSLLLHVLILVVAPAIDLNEAIKKPATTMVVNLAPPIKPSAPVQPPEPVITQPTKPAEPIKKPSTRIIAAKPRVNQQPTLTVPKVIDNPESNPAPSVPSTTQPTAPAPEAQCQDMACYIKAKQASRKGAEWEAARQNAEAIAREQGPSEAQVRDERIKRNFQNGTNGVFEITSLDNRNATFAFKGWTNDYSNARKQYFAVEAPLGQDVRLVMVKRMIALIREHYQEDFTWESHRLGRAVTKSARLEDNVELEDFLMMEFFGSHYKNS